MKNDLQLKLNDLIKHVTHTLSQTSRPNNFNGETFEIEEILPAEDCACVIWTKNTGKKAMAYFWWNYLIGQWCYSFPSSSQALFLDLVKKSYFEVEKHNFNIEIQNGKAHNC